jgi:hypothetical protein
MHKAKIQPPKNLFEEARKAMGDGNASRENSYS